MLDWMCGHWATYDEWKLAISPREILILDGSNCSIVLSHGVLFVFIIIFGIDLLFISRDFCIILGDDQ